MSALLSRMIMPIFGNAEVVTKYSIQKAFSLPRYAPWILPVTGCAAWFVWPAVTDDVKISLRMMKDPKAEAALQQKMAEEANELGDEAKRAVKNAYKTATHSPGPSTVDASLKAMASKGDFSPLHKDWEKFHQDSIVYIEEEEEDDEDEDEDEEESEDEDGEVEGDENEAADDEEDD